jgi:quaternary ammonium compound-resistance protein SugE
MNWLMLIVAGLLEIVWALGMKYSDGFTKPIPSAVTVLLIALSVYLLGQAVKTLPVGMAYGVWTGIGTVGTVIMGIFFFHESASPARLFCLALIIVGIIGLRLLPES